MAQDRPIRVILGLLKELVGKTSKENHMVAIAVKVHLCHKVKRLHENEAATRANKPTIGS